MATPAAVPHLAEFIRSRKAEILHDWEKEARHLSSARRVSRPVLIDHLPLLLDQIAALIDEITAGRVSAESKQAAREHGFRRLDAQVAVPELVREYFLLRDVIIRRWRDEHGTPASAGERSVLDRAIDETLIASVDEYMHVLRQEAETRTRQQQEAKREAQEAARAREDVMAIVSHDLRSPLQAIVMAAAGQIRGTVTIRASADDREVAFAVSDTGPGIAAEDLPHIFERYWRSEAAGYQGTGLGLAIVKGIVDTHGGRCWAESRPGGGSTFVIALPR